MGALIAIAAIITRHLLQQPHSDAHGRCPAVLLVLLAEAQSTIGASRRDEESANCRQGPNHVGQPIRLP